MRRRRRFVTAGRRRRFVTAGRRRRFGSTVFFSDYLLRYSDAVVPTKTKEHVYEEDETDSITEKRADDYFSKLHITNTINAYYA
ncbi:hypothetical protein Lal_00031259 [Lupinus albus]|nr:hypothetical protein Lal_00031259 [Lupinus albus]